MHNQAYRDIDFKMKFKSMYYREKTTDFMGRNDNRDMTQSLTIDTYHYKKDSYLIWI